MIRPILVTTHENPDTDALFSSLGLWWMATGKAGPVQFNSRPSPMVHHPTKGLFTVDVGGGELDHHYCDVGGGTTADRTTCAFRRCAEYVARHGSVEQVDRAAALLVRLVPAVQRQDCTGSITEPRDSVANVLSLAGLINRTVWSCQNDQAALALLTPLVLALFEQELAQWRATHQAVDLLRDVSITTDGSVVGYRATLNIGEPVAEDHIRTAIQVAYPDATLFVYHIAWLRNDGAIVTHSRGTGGRRRDGINICDALTRAKRHIHDAATLAEMRAWHQESWWCGRGGVKFPLGDPPPANMIELIVAALAATIN